MPIMKVACAPVDAPYFYSSLGRIYTECAAWRKNTIARIRQLRPVLTVMASSEGYSYQSADWRRGVSDVVDSLAESSQKVIILKDTPRPDFDVPTCLARQHWRSLMLPTQLCGFRFSAISNVYELIKIAKRSHSNVVTADLSQEICPHGICQTERNNLIMYRDS